MKYIYSTSQMLKLSLILCIFSITSLVSNIILNFQAISGSTLVVQLLVKSFSLNRKLLA